MKPHNNANRSVDHQYTMSISKWKTYLSRRDRNLQAMQSEVNQYSTTRATRRRMGRAVRNQLQNLLQQSQPAITPINIDRDASRKLNSRSIIILPRKVGDSKINAHISHLKTKHNFVARRDIYSKHNLVSSYRLCIHLPLRLREDG